MGATRRSSLIPPRAAPPFPLPPPPARPPATGGVSSAHPPILILDSCCLGTSRLILKVFARSGVSGCPRSCWPASSPENSSRLRFITSLWHFPRKLRKEGLVSPPPQPLPRPPPPETLSGVRPPSFLPSPRAILEISCSLLIKRLDAHLQMAPVSSFSPNNGSRKYCTTKYKHRLIHVNP